MTDVDALDRAGEIELARRTDALALDRAAGAERQILDHFAAVLAAAGQALTGEQHAGAVIIVFRHGDRAGAAVHRVGDAGGVERLDDRRLFLFGEAREQGAARRGAGNHPDDRGQAENGDEARERQTLGHRRLGEERARAPGEAAEAVSGGRGRRAGRHGGEFGCCYLAHITPACS